MAGKYVVTAAYITVRVKDDIGSEVVKGYYRGGVLPDSVNDDDLQRHLRKAMVAQQGSSEAEGVSPVGERVEFDSMGGPKAPTPASVVKRPAAPAKADKA